LGVVAYNRLVMKVTETRVHFFDVERAEDEEPRDFEHAALNMIENGTGNTELFIGSELRHRIQRVSGETVQFIEYFVIPEYEGIS
jgi:hypothetical protein